MLLGVDVFQTRRVLSFEHEMKMLLLINARELTQSM